MRPAELGLCLEFQLLHYTLANFNIVTRAEIYRLIQGKAVPVGVEVTHLDHGTDRGNLMVRRYGDIAARNQTAALKQADLDAALDVDLHHNRRHRGNELEL